MKKIILYLILIANFSAVIFFWYSNSFSLFSMDRAGIFIALGRLAGLMAELSILIQLTLIGRIKFIEKQYGFDRLNQLHRFNGFAILFFLVSHPLLLTIGYSDWSRMLLAEQFGKFLSNWPAVSTALVGLLIMIGAISISTPFIRRKLRYETWYFIHLLIYISIGLIFLHQIKTGDVSHGYGLIYWLFINFFVFGLVLIYRFIKPVCLFIKHGFQIKKIESEGDSVYSIYITGNKIDEFIFQPGQFANFIFLTAGMPQSHPFSFSNIPNGKRLRITIKKSGDFTNKLLDLPTGTKVIIDGPYGTFTEKFSSKEKYLFIAGGVGITPIRSLIESLDSKKKDMKLLYGNRNEKIPFANELLQFSCSCHFIISEHIDGEKILKLAPDFREREIYICGPQPMIKFLMQELKKINADFSSVHYEKFSY